jgi:hypothetical protein
LRAHRVRPVARWWTVTDLAERLLLPRDRVREAVRSGALPVAVCVTAVANDDEIAKRRLDAAYEPGWFERDRDEIRRELEARPGLLPDAALGETPAQIADAVEMAARKLYSEAEANQRYRQGQRVSQELAEMQHAPDKTHSIREAAAQRRRLEAQLLRSAREVSALRC